MMSLSSGVILLSALLLLPAHCSAFQPLPCKNGRRQCNVQLSMSTTANGAAPILKSILKKPSKVFTVGLEYTGGVDALNANEMSILSMQLRKSKVSAIFCGDASHAEAFVEEQSTAQGNFPGPCPVVYLGPPRADISVSAVVLSADDEIANNADCEVVWKVSSVDQVESILAKTDNAAEVFLIEDTSSSSSSYEELVQALPQGALCIASVESMQPEGAEVEQAKSLKKLGVHSILVREACVGDSEDLEYASFVIGGMTSKASSEFSFSGLTGSTNGHFGGVQARGTVNWQRGAKE
jgi:hypothetical protein